MEFILTGNPITGAEFERLGVVNRALPRQDVLPAATKLAEQIARNSGPIVKIAKQAVLTGNSPQPTLTLLCPMGIATFSCSIPSSCFG